MSEIKKLHFLLIAKHQHFLHVDYLFYKKFKFLIKIILFFNKNYRSCLIFRKRYKYHRNIVIVGLRWSGKNVKRRTKGYAKEFIQKCRDAKCIYCEKKLTQENATTDHIIPISRGGNNTQINFIVTCTDCNGERGDLEFYEYLKIKNKKFTKFHDIFI